MVAKGCRKVTRNGCNGGANVLLELITEALQDSGEGTLGLLEMAQEGGVTPKNEEGVGEVAAPQRVAETLPEPAGRENVFELSADGLLLMVCALALSLS